MVKPRLHGSPRISVDPLPPKEALAYWRSRTPVTDEQFSALDTGARSRAFAVTGLARLDRVEAVQRAVDEALANGETLADFKARISDIIAAQGWSQHRVDTIFRTNVQQAYQAGRYARMWESRELLPYWQYLTIEDERRRIAHAVLHGLVYPADHPFWDSNYPPNGHRCRCRARALTKAQVERRGLTVQRDMPGPTVWTDPTTGMEYHVQSPGADRGFAGNPGRDWLQGLAASPLDDGAVTFPQARALCRGGGPAFADGDDPCRPPLAGLAPRHILPVTAADILPRGLAPTAYVLEFLKEFGLKSIDATTTVRLPGVKLPVVIGKGLFLDKGTGDLKVTKEGREAYLRLLARTIRDPFEIWQVPAELSGRRVTVLRLLRLFRSTGRGGERIGGFAVFNLVHGRHWAGATTFAPKAGDPSRMLDYLERQRQGVLLYREGETPTP